MSLSYSPERKPLCEIARRTGGDVPMSCLFPGGCKHEETCAKHREFARWQTACEDAILDFAEPGRKNKNAR